VKLSLFIGDIAEAAADVVCTSTNPRLSLMMGTGGAVRERGGFGILRACEAIVEANREQTGKRDLRVGSVHVTSAGTLPYKAVIHCVAGDHNHVSSLPIVRACVLNALAVAAREGWKRIAMPVFGAGHARLKFEDALSAIVSAIGESKVEVEEVVIVVLDRDREAEARRLLASRA
jgi:O-acetyl-ADP-ribose deacetylase (regulator of RNase III)